MSHRSVGVWSWMLFASAVFAGSALAEPNWQAVDATFGFPGKVQPGDVHRYGWPRSDLHVRLGGVTLEPGLALGSWAGLVAAGSGDQVMAMGDLVLLEREVGPVAGALQAAGIEITAIHNHLLEESPHVMYLHFSAHGDAVAVARGLRAALAKSGTRTPSPAPKKVEPTKAEQEAFGALQEALGRQGTLAGRILQVSAPREEKIEDGGVEIPAGGFSLANPMNFQVVGKRIATTGDFVLTAAEVNPVMAELRSHGIAVTALHSHMLTETPRLFFMHFWGLDSPQRIGTALRAALAKVNVKPA